MPATLQRLPAAPSSRKVQTPAPEIRTLIDQLLAEQKTLQTPVARFAEIHDHLPDLEPHYRSLIPLTKPGSGEQYAFEVSLDRCTGCKACVSACHSLNGLDDGETWRDTGVLLGGETAPTWQQTITTACHHCEDPGCMNGCPVGAYEKDAQTGIVRHLDDQCIGCSYCILKCPYDVPKYSKKRGIVRKCDMCHQRLAEGEAPACVQACPTEAIRIVKVETRLPNTISALFPSHKHNPQSSLPSSTLTLPTTRYVGRDVPATAFAADRSALIPQHAHWPLIYMLVFTQAGIGLLVGNSTSTTLFAGTAIFLAGMAAAFLHLGQPMKAWRFFLGLKTSWLSREILAFSLFMPIPLMLCALLFLPEFPYKTQCAALLNHSLLPLGLISVFTSVMIYHDTHRSLWRFPLSATRFFGTVVAFAALSNMTNQSDHGLAQLIFSAVVTIKLIPELWFLRKNNASTSWSPDGHSAKLQLGPLRKILLARIVLAVSAVACVFVNPWLAMCILMVAELRDSAKIKSTLN